MEMETKLIFLEPPISVIVSLLPVIEILLNVGPKMLVAIFYRLNISKIQNTKILSTSQFSYNFWIYPIIWDFVILQKI